MTNTGRNWRDVRADAAKSGRIDEQAVSNAKKFMREELRAFKLSEIRKSQNLSQTEVAAGMNVAQPRVSAIERGELSRTELGTLESYIRALGGRLRLVADFGDETVVVQDIGSERVIGSL